MTEIMASRIRGGTDNRQNVDRTLSYGILSCNTWYLR